MIRGEVEKRIRYPHLNSRLIQYVYTQGDFKGFRPLKNRFSFLWRKMQKEKPKTNLSIKY